MINKYLKQQKGVTLVEVLGALAILSIISILAFNVLGNTFQYNEKTQAHTDIRQEANYIITQMRESHQTNQNDYEICTSTFERSNYVFNEFMINHNPINGSCTTVDATETLSVSFIIMNNQDQQFEVNTKIHPKAERNREELVSITIPDQSVDIIDYIRDESVFVYSSNISVDGSASFSSANGKMVINNNTPSDLSFNTAGQISVNEIHINKPNQQVNVNSSSEFGVSGVTSLINIRSHLNLNNGGTTMNAEEIYIDGDLTFGSSTVVNADTMYVSGDVIFNNYSADINADNIYIGGDIISNTNNSEHQQLRTGEFDASSYPDIPPNDLPELRDKNWYTENNYVNSGTLSDNDRIFSTGDVNVHTHNRNPSDFIIIAGGDVTIDTNWSEVEGLIVAPNGSVSYDGPKFSGVVIARDGFNLENGGASAEFRNINEYLDGLDEIPFK
ncbi:PulJ/GspJ family protein [Alkalibacillus salilacus]|uniref:Prepilin-type N-terminal cleavage/methylation domain-containing protein n=1 Tax=Alkalibacillus salilacus TaxID=284582 RepID=A0ABT9VG90_9BACI|nr:prepilin-type N-terminal cleavage/methylation domain-containing protein [Alkalibacillus salilacus]MDQ0159810.1 prepilin-type N-terminal cleavage/methylation domain-containing protein [Alkalibacillus salilacus]